MRFHLPKPLHGWRAFGGEVGIIVIGVLIALAAQQVVEAWQWRQQVKQAKEQLRNELTAITMEAYVRLVISSCVSRDLNEIATRLNRPSMNWSGMGGNAPTVIRVPYRPRVRNGQISAEAWNNAMATGIVNHFPYSEVGTLSTIYAYAKQLRDDERAESEAAAKLSPLAANSPLSPETRIAMLQTVNELQRMNWEIQQESSFIVMSVDQAGVGLTQASLRKSEDEASKMERADLGRCVSDFSFE
jgi:hypothetical protein